MHSRITLLPLLLNAATVFDVVFEGRPLGRCLRRVPTAAGSGEHSDSSPAGSTGDEYGEERVGTSRRTTDQRVFGASADLCLLKPDIERAVRRLSTL